MDKSDAYVVTGHLAAVSLFFKQEREVHLSRKKIWLCAFAGNTYVALI